MQVYVISTEHQVTHMFLQRSNLLLTGILLRCGAQWSPVNQFVLHNMHKSVDDCQKNVKTVRTLHVTQVYEITYLLSPRESQSLQDSCKLRSTVITCNLNDISVWITEDTASNIWVSFLPGINSHTYFLLVVSATLEYFSAAEHSDHL